MKNIFRKTIAYILRIESVLVIWKYKPKIIAITGSVGKTSTKDAVFAVLSEVSHVRKSEKSYNSEIGLPLTILGLPNGWNNPLTWFKNICKGLWLFLWPHKYPQMLVLEVGVGKQGDMRKTASWLHTDAVIITAIGETPAHIEFFNSRKSLIEEKSKLIKTLKKNGLLVLNADDPDVIQMKSKTKNLTTTYGFLEGADVLGSGYNIFYLPAEAGEGDVPEGVIFRIQVEGKSLPVIIEGVFGKNHVYACLAALTLASGLKLNMIPAIEAVKNYDVSPGRMRLLKGINETLLIDDTYNSSPMASLAALQTLGEIKMPIESGRKIAVLGDMLQLGKHTIDAHKNIGKIAKEFCDVLVVVGARAKAIKEGAEENGMLKENIHEFENSHEAVEFMKDFIKKGDLILIKGSQGMRMERVTEALLLEKENKNKLLVRQDEEWKKKN